jgi:D-alanyl-D-alanine carboxypeptidase
MNCYSNNFMADLLLVSLGEVDGCGSGSERVREWFAERVGVSPPPTIIDGSGLSVRNQTTARQIVRLLIWAHGQERVFPDLFASMPRPGGVGTLQSRFKGSIPPALRAKTGTLGNQGVSGMAGYVDHPSEGRFAFCILQQASRPSKTTITELRMREEHWLHEFVTP